MKKLSFLIILLGLSVFANARDQSLGSACLEMKSVARIVMSARQSGMEPDVLLSTTLEALRRQTNGESDKYEQAVKLTTNMVERAYNTPIYDSEHKKSKAITQFGNEIENLCNIKPESLYLKKSANQNKGT